MLGFLICSPLALCASDQSLIVPAPTSEPEPTPLSQPTSAPVTAKGKVVFLGDSITSGYGLGDPLNQTYPALIQKKIKAEGWNFEVVNAGISGDTTAGGLGRIKWAMKGNVEVLVIALGGNDGLRGVDPRITAKNLSDTIITARQLRPGINIVIAGMRMPQSMGETFTQAYSNLYPTVARKERVALVPYFLAGVGGVAGMNQPDLIHPTIAGQSMIAETVWRTLRPTLEARINNTVPPTFAPKPPY